MIVKNEAALNHQLDIVEPVVLGWYHLGIWFHLIGFLLILSIIIFSLEIIVHKVMFLCRISKYETKIQNLNMNENTVENL